MITGWYVHTHQIGTPQVGCKYVVEFNNHSSPWTTLLWRSGGAVIPYALAWNLKYHAMLFSDAQW